MGGGFSCMKSSTSSSHKKRNPKKGTRPINLIGTKSENVQVRYKEEQQTKITRRSSTLKECLLASPNDYHEVNPSKIQLFSTELSPSPSPLFKSSSEVQIEELYTSRKGFPRDKVNGNQSKVDEKDEDEGARFNRLLERSESQKVKKKVSFRFPEEADIFIFCSEN
ncbi:hypothetical protein L1887_34766 [Cichorium endivia]|nr:hypothetical protein L1887_34766 [Cichorium endivia]